MSPFRRNDWNEGHIGRHNFDRDEAEQVIRRARRPYPKYVGDGRWLVRGQTDTGEYLLVAYIYTPPRHFLSFTHAHLPKTKIANGDGNENDHEKT
jgi:hypothetical protein